MTAFYLSAPGKSSGKTLLAVGLAAAFRNRALVVQTFKKGPDFIDAGWLSLASGRPCRNLDFHTQCAHEMTRQFAAAGADAAVTLVEGTKGLHDGVATDGSDSNAALAHLLGVPVVLVLDTRGITRGVAPLVLGMARFEPRINVAGVILNRVGGSRHEAKLRAALASYTDISVLGAVGNDPVLSIPERHLGLTSSAEAGARAEQMLVLLGERLAASVDMDALLALEGSTAPATVRTATTRTQVTTGPGRPLRPGPGAGSDLPGADLRVGVARDAAFCFYYPDNLEAMTAAGASLVYFDTLRDRGLPEVDALYIGGGFPETSARALADNQPMRAAVAEAARAGLPIYAECGGLMYLGTRLRSGGADYPMCGALPLATRLHQRPRGRGYVRLAPTGHAPFVPLDCSGASCPSVAAHEFHYSSIEAADRSLRFGYQMLRGHGVDGQHDGIVWGNIFASYAHLRQTEGCRWVEPYLAWIKAKTVARTRAGLCPP